MVVCNHCNRITWANAQHYKAHSASVECSVENYNSTETMMMEKKLDRFLDRMVKK